MEKYINQKYPKLCSGDTLFPLLLQSSLNCLFIFFDGFTNRVFKNSEHKNSIYPRFIMIDQKSHDLVSLNKLVWFERQIW